MIYHTIVDCKPSRVFRAKVRHNIINHKLGLRLNSEIVSTANFADELLRRNKILYDKTKRNVMQSHIKYKKC